MTNETLRMQMLAGVITEGEYKAKLQESLWDRIKNTPKAWVAKIKGGTPATMASALSDGGFKIGVPVYAYDGGELNKMTIKSINYNTGISDVIYEKSLDGGKNWKTDEKESLKTKLGLDQDLSSLLKKTPEEQKTWYDETVKTIKDNFTTKDMSYSLEDAIKQAEIGNQKRDERIASLSENKKKKSLKESMIGGIVGIGAINQIPSREKTDYEMAFEHFLGERQTKIENREQDPYTMKEGEVEEGKEVEEPSLYEEEVNENVGSTIDKMLQTFEFSEKGNDEMIEFGNYLLSPKGPKNIAVSIKNKLKGPGGENYFTSKPEKLDAFLSKLK
jgi:hypothetical protein